LFNVEAFSKPLIFRACVIFFAFAGCAEWRMMGLIAFNHEMGIWFGGLVQPSSSLVCNGL
jgi:hypothetical protein